MKSTILGIRADAIPDADCTKDCNGFFSADTSRAIDYAVSKGARVINMSFGSENVSSPTFRAAVERAAAAGVVFTASAGNEGDDRSEWPAHLAVEGAVAGSLLAVGATHADDSMASFSNRAGSAAAGLHHRPGRGRHHRLRQQRQLLAGLGDLVRRAAGGRGAGPAAAVFPAAFRAATPWRSCCAPPTTGPRPASMRSGAMGR